MTLYFDLDRICFIKRIRVAEMKRIRVRNTARKCRISYFPAFWILERRASLKLNAFFSIRPFVSCFVVLSDISDIRICLQTY